MTDEKDREEAGALDDLKGGFKLLFGAARKAVKGAEPKFRDSLDDAERVLEKLGKGSETVAHEVSKEVAVLAGKLADKLREVADRPDEKENEKDKAPETGGRE